MNNRGLKTGTTTTTKIAFTVSSESPNYLGIDLTKDTKDLGSENDKALSREMKESLNKRRDLSQCSLFADSTFANSRAREDVLVPAKSIMAVLSQ